MINKLKITIWFLTSVFILLLAIQFSALDATAVATPTANALTILSGNNQITIGSVLTGKYTFNANGGTSEKTGAGGTTYKWQISTDKSSWSDISGASGTISASGSTGTYTVVAGDAGKYIKYAITPVNTDPTTGAIVYSTPEQVSSATYAQWATGYGSGNAIDDFNTDNITSGTNVATATYINNWLVAANKTYSFLNNDSSNTTPYFITADAKRNVSTFKNSSGDGKVIVDIRLKTPDSSDTTNSSNPFVLVYLNDANAGNNVGLLYAYKTFVRYTAKDSTLNNKNYDKTGLTAGTWYYIRAVLDYTNYKATVYSGTSLSSLTAFATNVDMSYYASNANTASLGIASIRYAPTTATTSGGIDDLSIYGYTTGGAVAPSASTPTVSGTYQQGQALTPSYTYTANDGGTEVSSPFIWETATDANFTQNVTSVASGNTTSSTTSTATYTIQAGDTGKYIRFKITPKGNSTLYPFTNDDFIWGTYQSSGRQIAAAPIATNVGIISVQYPKVGDVLTGTYTYFDANGDVDSGSTFRWLISSDNINFTAISGATRKTYTTQAADKGSFIAFEVTPKNNAALLPTGIVAQSLAVKISAVVYALNDDFETGYTAGTSAAGATVNGWVAASGKTITVTGANITDANTSWFMSATGVVAKTLAYAVNNSSGDNILVIDTRVKTPASGSSWVQTKGSNGNYLTQIQVGSNYIQFNYNTTTNSTGITPSGLGITGITVTPSTWYYIRQVLDFSTKKVTLYYSATAINKLSVFKTDAVTSTTDFCYTAGLAPTDLKSFINNAGTIDDVAIYYGNTGTPKASNLNVSGFDSLAASYLYSNDAGVPEYNSIYKWETSEDNYIWTTVASGMTTAINGSTYKRRLEDNTTYIRFTITPTTKEGPVSVGSSVSFMVNPLYTAKVSLINATDGTPASLISGGSIKANINIANYIPAPQSFVLVSGLYNQNKLIKTSLSDNFSVAANGTSVKSTNLPFNVSVASGYTVKTFVWSDFTLINPLMPVKITPSSFTGFEWQEIMNKSQSDSKIKSFLDKIKSNADNTIKNPITVRVYNEADIPPVSGYTTLAMFDTWATSTVSINCIPVALAARYTGNQVYIDYVNAQMREMATWSPLQRPGWSGITPLPAGGDGCWLSTGYGIWDIIEILDIMGDLIDPVVKQNLKALLQNEVNGIVADWNAKRPWSFASGRASTNQWIVPFSGLVGASLYLGGSNNADAYNLGIARLIQSLQSEGNDGSYDEGYGYSLMSSGYLFQTALAMKQSGDERLMSYGFMNNYLNWITQMTMPGKYIANTMDTIQYQLTGYVNAPFITGAFLLNDKNAVWYMNNFYSGFNTYNDYGLLYYYRFLNKTLDSSFQPPKYQYFPNGRMVMWRSGWDMNNSIGLWLKGGSINETTHAHWDKGHISVVDGNTPILIETGCPSYSDPLIDSYKGVTGHNVLQATQTSSAALDVPITVNSLDATSGNVLIDGKKAYTNVTKWNRSIIWDNNASFSLNITDDTQLTTTKNIGDEWFRFHTGAASTADLTVQGSDYSWTVTCNSLNATMQFTSNKKISIHIVQLPDHSTAAQTHACIFVKGAESTNAMNLVSRLTVN